MGIDGEIETQKLKSVAPGHPLSEWQSWNSNSGVFVRSKLGPFIRDTLENQVWRGWQEPGHFTEGWTEVWRSSGSTCLPGWPLGTGFSQNDWPELSH